MKAEKDHKFRRHLGMKDIPEQERPCERLIAAGPKVLSDAELLAVIIKTGLPDENVVSLARRILMAGKDGSLSGLHEMSFAALKRIKGIGDAKAAQILAVCELSDRIVAERSNFIRKKVNNISQIGNLLAADMRWHKKEVFKVVMVDCKWQILKIEDISMGSLNQSIVHPREVFVEAVKNYSAAVILAHNHPSGDPTPSAADLETTLRLVSAGAVLGIDVADHIITGGESFYSMHMSGDLQKIRERALAISEIII